MSEEIFSFIRTRTRMQRLSDAKLFSGWVVSMSPYEVVVRVNDQNFTKLDDRIFVQAFGDKVTGTFTGRVVSTRNQTVTLAFETSLKTIKANEELRLKTDLMLGEIDAAGFKLEFQLVDISSSGLGVITKLPLVKGGTVRFSVMVDGSELASEAEVRYCRPIESDQGQFRVGLKIKDPDRVCQARWHRFIDSLADAA